MATDEIKSSSSLPLTNSNAEFKIYSVLPAFGLINLTISSATTIYRAFNKGDTPMIVFTTLVFLGTFLLDYWFRLYRKLPPSEKSSKHHSLKIGIWVLLSAIMFGFAYEFSTFMSLAASLSFFGVVICGNALLFYVYFIWDGEGKSRQSRDSCCVSENVEEEENKQFLETLDKV